MQTEEGRQEEETVHSYSSWCKEEVLGLISYRFHWEAAHEQAGIFLYYHLGLSVF